jgi:Tannase and feruloyl esterase
MRRFALALVLAIAALSGGAPASYAQNINCSGTVGGGAAVTNIAGNVTVLGGASCTLEFVNITGNITVQPGGSLLVAAYLEPSTIGGNVVATNCGSTLLEGNVTVKGNVQIQNCSGAAANGFQGPGIAVGGSFQCLNNAGPCEAWLGQIAGSAQILNNRGGASDVSLNTIEGNLQCQNNTAAPTHNHGYNWVTGIAQGQCAVGFTTTSTSIGVPPSSGVACASLASLPASAFPVPNTVITSATDTPASAVLPERCVVNGYVNHRVSAVDSCPYQDGFQVQLPLPAAWNGRFFMQGGGGTEGSVPPATGNNSGSAGANFGITNGYAVASQDGGHENSQLLTCGTMNTNEFFLDPMGTIDFAYQSIDVTTLTAKYLIAAYYGSEAGHSYWVGCSTGGRQGMVMSQNFPQYFNGIVDGDPVYDLQALQLSEIWSMEQILDVYNTATPPLVPPTPAYVPGPPPQPAEPILYPAFPVSDQSLFETALLQACDALDGVSDGVIDNLPACRATFDPTVATYTVGNATYPLQCPGPKNPTCLSKAQIAAVVNTNKGPGIKAPAGAVAPNYVDNTAVGYAYDGGFMTTVGIPARDIGKPTSPPGNFAAGTLSFPYAFISPPDPSYYILDFNFATDTSLLKTSTPVVSYSTSLDISKFINYGHKIIWYHGLSDPGPPVLGTIVYYNAMANRYGGLQASQSFSRLYPVPNMDHCTGGATTDQFDLLTPLTQWVENSTPPGQITAKGVNFTAATYQVGFVSGPPANAPTTRSRPLCPYPQEARFTGSTTIMNGIPVATNPADLANASNYSCIMPSPPYLQ